VSAPWRVAAEGLDGGCEASVEGSRGARRGVLRELSEGSWGTHRGVPRGSPTPPRRGVVPGPAWASLRPLGAVVPAVAENVPEGSLEPSGRGRRGACRGCPGDSLKWSSRVTAGTFEGLRRAPARLPAGAFDRLLLGACGGSSQGASRRSVQWPLSGRLEVSERRLECPSGRRIGGSPQGRLGMLSRAYVRPVRRRAGTPCDAL
jgi:hypothetical protein